MQERKAWENSIQSKELNGHTDTHNEHDHDFKRQEIGYWRKSAVMSFFKQFYSSITYNDYKALRSGFIKTHCPTNPNFDFHKYMLRTLEVNFKFKRLVGISWYLWLFVVFFLLLNIEGKLSRDESPKSPPEVRIRAPIPRYCESSHPELLLLVGAKLKHIITRLVQEAAERETGDQAQPLKPSDHHFWVVVQVLCSCSTLPLYALATQMGSMFRPDILEKSLQLGINNWLGEWGRGLESQSSHSHRMTKQSFEADHIAEETTPAEETTTSIIELSRPTRPQESSP
ncbi:MLO-like protein [Actinidia chinensis var. chinensis]|uniref:MLO-like protein n=1 Tax=Actinidia chinensis var. chinensis TaxID=1590841 RepID=A0A2R6QII3_ACTCC|nr:MLO-like protein [Actinidia chinensis var. chinensis]